MKTKLRSTARWMEIAARLFVVLAAIGSLIVGFNLAPEDCRLVGTLSGPEFRCLSNEGAQLGLSLGFFIASLIPLLPYFAIARLLEGVAELLEGGGSGRASRGRGGGSPHLPSAPDSHGYERLPPPEDRTPGWQPDPADPTQERWWDGRGWLSGTRRSQR